MLVAFVIAVIFVLIIFITLISCIDFAITIISRIMTIILIHILTIIATFITTIIIFFISIFSYHMILLFFIFSYLFLGSYRLYHTLLYSILSNNVVNTVNYPI